MNPLTFSIPQIHLQNAFFMKQFQIWFQWIYDGNSNRNERFIWKFLVKLQEF